MNFKSGIFFPARCWAGWPVTDGEQPYIVPVTFSYDGEYIYGQTAEGKKLAILQKNPKVCFEVDSLTDMMNWQSVLVFGVFEPLKGEEAVKARRFLFDRIYGLMTSATVHAHEHGVSTHPDDSNRIKPVIYRIRIAQLNRPV